MACAAACARKSQVTGIPQHFIAGREECMIVAARDSFGGATEGGDDVSLTLDHATEGLRKLTVEVKPLPKDQRAPGHASSLLRVLW